MRSRILSVVIVWTGLVSAAQAQLRDATVTRPTRLDWVEAAAPFHGGQTAPTLPDYNSTRQTYQLYVPERYHKSKAWPLVIFISPSPSPIGWDHLGATCEQREMFFCSPYGAGNNTNPVVRTHIILDAIDDIRRNYRIDPQQTYLGGFSGGGRMACSLAFALPELFAGAFPVCGTNPPRGTPYLRHRLVDRVSLAIVTGARDFNREECEKWIHPCLRDLGVRTRLWVVPRMAHDIPGPEVMDDIIAWLAADRERRQADAESRPQLAWGPEEVPDGDDWAARLLGAARADLRVDRHIWRGVATIQWIKQRWPDSDAARATGELLADLIADERRADLLIDQRLEDDLRATRIQAHGLEQAGRTADAIRTWQVIQQNYAGTPAAETAREEIERLQTVKPAPPLRRPPAPKKKPR